MKEYIASLMPESDWVSLDEIVIQITNIIAIYTQQDDWISDLPSRPERRKSLKKLQTALGDTPFLDGYPVHRELSALVNKMLEETSTLGRSPEIHRRWFLEEMADIYEQVTGHRAEARKDLSDFVVSCLASVPNAPPLDPDTWERYIREQFFTKAKPVETPSTTDIPDWGYRKI